MIAFYFNLSPNPMKVALALEEMELPYRPVPVDTRTGAQFAPDFLRINPNGKVPAIVDESTGATVFDSNAILLHLANGSGRFGPGDGEGAAFLSWHMFVATGLGPFSGQAVHFRHYAPDTGAYAHTRYQYEADRHYRVLDGRLAESRYLAGERYTVVDMAAWGWIRLVPFVLGDDGAWERYPNLKRLFDEISARPAAARVETLRARYADAFRATMDADAIGHMFKHRSFG